MFKIEDVVGDIVFVSFRDIEKLKDLGINTSTGHFLIQGIDHIGIWLSHPGIIIAKTEDENGKPIPEEKIIKEKIKANFLVTWDNINTIMHYPEREGFDFPSEFEIDIGFKK